MSEDIGSEEAVPQIPLDDFDIAVPLNNESVSYFHESLREVVNIHEHQFEKLLYNPEEIPLELAELFEQVGNRYLDYSVEISEICLAAQSKLNNARNPRE